MGRGHGAAAPAQESDVIRRRDLLRALGDYDLADWVLVERQQECATVDTRLVRNESWLRWLLTVHHDAATGRGSAQVHIDAASGDAAAAVRQAVTLARASIDTAWVTRPPAAPARVTVADPVLANASLADAAAALLRSLARPSGVTVDASADVTREQVVVETRHGLHTEWSATRIRFDALVGSNAHVIAVRRDARRLTDLALPAALDDAATDLAHLAKAGAASPGPCTLVVTADALLHDGLGLWAAFVTQADAVVERQGLTRYREHSPVAPGADTVPAPLSIESNGALDFGLESAPVGDEGDAIRRFPLVERGVAAGLALSPREGALRGRDPNGGVRNLAVDTGTWNRRALPSGSRTIEVRRLRSLTFDPYTGDASLEIQLGLEHTGGDARRPFTGGSIRLDAIAALARARRSTARIRRGGYTGPDAVLIENVELLT
jgi:predicted Zn-dependent protease